LPAQADMMQARWGSHGDYGIIALCPNSPQECFDLTIQAFNLSEEFRVPVMLMLDECVGHMTEKVVIPEADRIEVTPRRYTRRPPEEFRLFEPQADLVPDMVRAGEGYRFHVTGLTHDERGYPSMNVETQDRSVRRIQDKLKPLANGRALCETEDLEDAEVVVVSYGITSRVAQRAIQMARRQGIRAGKFRIISAWPFPAQRIGELAGRVKAFVMPELNLGQMVHEVARVVEGRAKVIPVTHAGGSVHNPDAILKAITEAVR
jgi:2-oxoglutarate/2-oxoacid ferredoxin oxidoreductase subunit alpha